MKFGTIKTVNATENLAVTEIDKYRFGTLDRSIKTYRIRIKVTSAQEEMTEYIKFTDEVAKYRSQGKLTFDKEDESTRPMFILEYPKENIDGSYFIIKCYSIEV